MTKIKRAAPHPERVLMYRQGIPAAKIAAGAGVAGSVVRYHLTLAGKEDTGLRDEHRKALPPSPARLTAAGHRTLNDLLAFRDAEKRLPATGRDARETTLAGWLARRRKEAAAGSLAPAYAHTLDANEDRWAQRLQEVAAYLAAGRERPCTTRPMTGRNAPWVSGSTPSASPGGAANSTRPRKPGSTTSSRARSTAGRRAEQTAGLR